MVVRDWKVITPLLCKIILWKAWLMIMTVSEINDNELSCCIRERKIISSAQDIGSAQWWRFIFPHCGE